MPRYFFNTEDGHYEPDRTGSVLRDIEEAKLEAARYLAERLRERPGEVWDTGLWRVVVTDETGLTLFMLDVSATFAAAFPTAAKPSRNGPVAR